MSLSLLLRAIQASGVVNVANTIVQVVHACVEEFGERDRKQDADIAAVKEMVARLEDRVNERIEGVRVGAARESELVGGALEAHIRLHGGTPGGAT